MTQNERSMMDNYLEFLRTHRGKVNYSHNAFIVESGKDDFTFAIANSETDIVALSSSFKKVYASEKDTKIISDLNDKGFKRAFGLTFMHLQNLFPSWTINDSVIVKKVENEKEMEAFSKVQCRGFSESEEEYDEWYSFLKDANFKNIQNPNQFFYVGYIEGKPVGVALSVKTPPLIGIYAVATLQQNRKQGISTTIMRHAVVNAVKEKSEAVILQVVSASYAHSFYKKLGFKDSFELEVFTKS